MSGQGSHGSTSTHLQQQQLGWPLRNGCHELQVFGLVKPTGAQGGAKQMYDSFIVSSLIQPLNLFKGLAPLQRLQVLIDLEEA